MDGEEGLQFARGAHLVQVQLYVFRSSAETAGTVIRQQLLAVARHAVGLQEQTVALPCRTNQVQDLSREHTVLWAVSGVVAELGPDKGGQLPEGQHVRHTLVLVPSARLLQVVARVEDHAKLGGRVERNGVVGPVLVLGSDHTAAANEVEGEDISRGDGGLVAHAVVAFAHTRSLGQVASTLGHKLLERDIGWWFLLRLLLFLLGLLLQQVVTGVVTEGEGTGELLVRLGVGGVHWVHTCGTPRLSSGQVCVPLGQQVTFRVGTAGAQLARRGEGGRWGGGGGRGDGR